MSRIYSRKTRSRRRRRGAAAVEFAITFPILLIFFIFMWEFSRAEMIRQTAATAAYEGARQTIVVGGSAEDAKEKVAEIMQAVGIADAEVSVTPSIIVSATEKVQVDITVPLASNAWISPLFMKDLHIQSNMSLRR